VVIINNGSDGATSQMWVHGGAAATERGYHWMTFDGPGQQAALVDRDCTAVPIWEAVLTQCSIISSTARIPTPTGSR
jgi:hypothetical protein